MHQVLDASLEVSMHVLDVQAISGIHVPHKLPDLGKVISAVKEECQHASYA